MPYSVFLRKGFAEFEASWVSAIILKFKADTIIIEENGSKKELMTD